MPAQPDYDSLQQAAGWFAQLRADDVTERDRACWRAWLEQSGAHREAWQYIEAVSRRFEPLQAGVDNAASKTLASVRGRRVTRRQALNVFALVGVGALAWSGSRHTPLLALAQSWRADHRTATGEIRALTLGDGSRAWLNTASALDEDFQPALRRLRLFAGEVLIETAHEAARPFVVDTEHGRLRALGTRFTVRAEEGGTALAVYEGAVEVVTAASGQARVIAAGQQVSFDGAAIAAPVQAERARQAWSRGVLLADDISLRDLLAELSRYRHGHLAAAPAVAELRVMGAFPLQDPERILAMLEDALPVRVDRPLPWWTTVDAK